MTPGAAGAVATIAGGTLTQTGGSINIKGGALFSTAAPSSMQP